MVDETREHVEAKNKGSGRTSAEEFQMERERGWHRMDFTYLT